MCFFPVDPSICPSSNHNRHFDREKMDSREKPARAFHARRGKRENSGPAASSRQNSQPSANVGPGPFVGCMSFVSSSVIDAAKVRCAEHERSVHQRDCQPYSAERCKIGGASLALCAASILTKSTHWSDQRPPVSHASVSSLTLPRACHASLYCVGLRFSLLSIAPPAWDCACMLSGAENRLL